MMQVANFAFGMLVKTRQTLGKTEKTNWKNQMIGFGFATLFQVFMFSKTFMIVLLTKFEFLFHLRDK